MFRSSLLRGASAGALTLSLLSAAAFAQEALPTIDIGVEQRADGKPARKVEDPKTYRPENASTATKTDTPIMETPVSVQVVPQQVLQDQQVVTLDQALKNVSGVTTGGVTSIYGNGDNFGSVFLRGFATNTIFRNGFRLDAGTSANLGAQQFANVERVEILKGPAAIMYGQVEPGGIVNIRTKQPLATPKYSVIQQIGSYAKYRTSVDATGPLTKDEALLYRMNMSYENSASFSDLVYTRDFFLAPVIRWNIDSRTNATIEYEYLDANDGGMTPFVPRLANGQWLDIPRGRNYGEKSPYKTRSYFVEVGLAHQFNDDWSIKQRFSSNRKTINSPDNVIAGYLVDTGTGVAVSRYSSPNFNSTAIWSVNTDVIGHFDTPYARHTLLAGGDYYRYNNAFRTFFNFSSLIDISNPIHPGTPFPLTLYPGYGSKQDNDAFGAYLQDQIELPYNVFVMGGARYQYIYQSSAGVDLTTGAVTPNPALRSDALTPRAGLLWRPQRWLSLYGNYVEGFGPNSGLIYPGTPVPPSGARQWEGGVKVELFDEKLRATAAYFDLTKTNVPTVDPNPAHAGYQIVTGEVRSKGLEFDLQGEVAPGWQLIASYTNTSALVTKTNSSDYWNKVGARFYDVPRNTASIWTTYDFQQPDLSGLKIGGGVTFRDSIPQFDGLTNNFYNLPSYATIDLMTSYSFDIEGAKLTAQVNVTNLLDTKYYTYSYTDSAFPPDPVREFSYGVSYRAFGAPRSLLGSLKVEF